MSLLQLIKEKVNIVDVISEDTDLKQSLTTGEYIGSCPFHEDNHPSFTVDEQNGIFHCFSCHESGNVVTYYEKIKNISYEEALYELAKKYHIDYNEELENESIENYEKYKKYINVMNDCQQYFKTVLANDNEAKQYLKEQRKLTDEEIDFWDIGLDDGNLYNYLLQQGYRINELVDYGIVKTNQDGTIRDFYYQRITYPLKDERGNILGFSARIYKKGDNRKSKYLNTKNNNVFKKNETLFNIDNLRKHYNEFKNKGIYLFEGQQDVISSYNAGLINSLASLGTSLTEKQINKILKMTDKIIICYDSDKAGYVAKKKAIELFKKNNKDISIYIINFPENYDADEYIKLFGKENFIDFMNNNQISYIKFLIDDTIDVFLNEINKKGIDQLDIQEKIRLYKKIIKIIDYFCNVLEKQFYIKKINEYFNIEENINDDTFNDETVKIKDKSCDDICYFNEEKNDLDNAEEVEDVDDNNDFDLLFKSNNRTEQKLMCYILKNNQLFNKEIINKFSHYFNNYNRNILDYVFNGNTTLNDYENKMLNEYLTNKVDYYYSEDGLIETIKNNYKDKQKKKKIKSIKKMIKMINKEDNNKEYLYCLQQIIKLK